MGTRADAAGERRQVHGQGQIQSQSTNFNINNGYQPQMPNWQFQNLSNQYQNLTENILQSQAAQAQAEVLQGPRVGIVAREIVHDKTQGPQT